MSMPEKRQVFLESLQESIPALSAWNIERQQYLCGPREDKTHTSIGVKKDAVSVRLNLFGRNDPKIQEACETLQFHLGNAYVIEPNDPASRDRNIILRKECSPFNTHGEELDRLFSWIASRAAVFEFVRPSFL